jgi:hypothetical protein
MSSAVEARRIALFRSSDALWACQAAMCRALWSRKMSSPLPPTGEPPVSFDLADPSVMVYALTAVIVTCIALDVPALSSALRFFRLKRRLVYARNRVFEARRQPR